MGQVKLRAQTNFRFMVIDLVENSFALKPFVLKIPKFFVSIV